MKKKPTPKTPLTDEQKFKEYIHLKQEGLEASKDLEDGHYRHLGWRNPNDPIEESKEPKPKGRPGRYKEPTTTMRVPISLIPKINALIEEHLKSKL